MCLGVRGGCGGARQRGGDVQVQSRKAAVRHDGRLGAGGANRKSDDLPCKNFK